MAVVPTQTGWMTCPEASDINCPRPRTALILPSLNTTDDEQ
ncbi:uncharacterized protein G2W53_020783 [Senna tora]|uniref:Uncharacterized protein n=1 Tax=Senna tora TaxID=362788 RepID=A0A834TK88_9FABA|nr:uncharacterized protein G2W53_020783 [Senna tora]